MKPAKAPHSISPSENIRRLTSFHPPHLFKGFPSARDSRGVFYFMEKIDHELHIVIPKGFQNVKINIINLRNPLVYSTPSMQNAPNQIVIPKGFQNVKNKHDNPEESPRVLDTLNARGDSSKMTYLFLKMNFYRNDD